MESDVDEISIEGFPEEDICMSSCCCLYQQRLY